MPFVTAAVTRPASASACRGRGRSRPSCPHRRGCGRTPQRGSANAVNTAGRVRAGLDPLAPGSSAPGGGEGQEDGEDEAGRSVHRGLPGSLRRLEDRSGDLEGDGGAAPAVVAVAPAVRRRLLGLHGCRPCRSPGSPGHGSRSAGRPRGRRSATHSGRDRGRRTAPAPRSGRRRSTPRRPPRRSGRRTPRPRRSCGRRHRPPGAS